MDYDIKYRPRTLDEVVGQPDAVKILRGFGSDPPRALCIHGQTGCGKTTMARIVAATLGIPTDGTSLDYMEVNCAATEKPTELVRDIRSNMSAAAVGGTKRMWVLDEVQAWSKSKGAQEALLMVLESPPPHVLFVLCTTDPKRLIAPIRGRCNMIPVRGLKDDEILTLVKRVAAAERVKTSPALLDAIVRASNGSARDALKELQKAAAVGDPDEASRAVSGIGAAKAAFDLVKVLLPWKGHPAWAEVAKVLEEIKEEDPETVRQVVLASARTMLIRTGSSLAHKVIICLSEPLYDRSSGHALLAAYAFEVCNGRPK